MYEDSTAIMSIHYGLMDWTLQALMRRPRTCTHGRGAMRTQFIIHVILEWDRGASGNQSPVKVSEVITGHCSSAQGMKDQARAIYGVS